MTDNGPFSRMLARRIKSWAAAPKIGAVIHTPPELAWWYYNEFGTATKREGMGPPTGYYEIPGYGISIFTYKGEHHRRKAGVNPVHHPGTHASHAVSLAQPDYQHALSMAVKTGFAHGSLDSPAKVQASIESGMEEAKELIARNYDALLQHNDYHSAPGGIEGTGKLEGRKAADDYRKLAQVKDIKE